MRGKMSGVLSFKSIAVFSFLLMVFTAGAMAQQGAKMEELMRAQIQKARKALKGTTWTVYTTLEQAGTNKPEEGSETFTFTDRRVTTQNLAALGYAPDGSNYSVRYETDGVLVWETMQKHKDGEGEALVSGGLKGNVMAGVIDIHPAKGSGQRKIYHFTSQKEKPASVVKTGTATATDTTPAAAKAAATTKKKGKKVSN